MLLCVADVLAVEILAQSFIAVTGIYKHDVGVLLMSLAHHTVDIEALAAAGWAEYEEVGVICQFFLAFLSTDVYSNWDSLTVGIVDLERCVLAMDNVFLVHQTSCGVSQCQKAVVVLTGGIAVSGKGVDEQLKLVICPLADMNAHTAEGVL